MHHGRIYRRTGRRPSSVLLTLGAVVPLLVGCPVDNRLLGLPPSVAGDTVRDDGGDGGSSSNGTPGGGGGDDVFERGGTSGDNRGGTGGRDAAGAGEDGGAGTASEPGMAGGSTAGAGMAGSVTAGGAGFSGASGAAGASGASGASGGGGQPFGGAGAGAGMGGIGGIGGADAAGAAGHAGASTVIVCGDIDLNGYDDCSETLARNSRFDHDVNSWQSDYRVITTWSAEDANDQADSGAVSVTFSTDPETSPSMAGAWQCVPEISVGFYEVGANAFIPAGQGAGWAAINLFLFSGTSCTGSLVSGQSLRLEDTTGSWLTVSGEIHVPPDAGSMAVRLVAVKPGNQTKFSVLFDNVLLRTE